MAAGLSSPLGIAGIVFLIIGIIMAVIGIILLIANQNNPKPWYIWLLLIGGIVLGILGGIMLAIALSRGPKDDCCPPAPACVDACGRVVVQQPAMAATPTTITTAQPANIITTTTVPQMVATA